MNEKIKTITVSTLWIIMSGLIITTIIWLCLESPSLALIIVTLFMLTFNLFLATILSCMIVMGTEFFLPKDWEEC